MQFSGGSAGAGVGTGANNSTYLDRSSDATAIKSLMSSVVVMRCDAMWCEFVAVLGKRLRTEDVTAYPVGDGSKHFRSDGSAQLRKKIFVPTAEYPDVNWHMLLIGRASAQQKEIELMTGAKFEL